MIYINSVDFHFKVRGLLPKSPWTFTPKSVDFLFKVRGLLLLCPWTFANKSVDFFLNRDAK